MDDAKPVERFVVGVWRVLGTIGEIRLFLILVAVGVAYLVMGNTAGRIIGAAVLAVVILWIWRLAKSFANPSY